VGLPARAPDAAAAAPAAGGQERASTLLHALGVAKRGQSGVAPADAARGFLASAGAQARAGRTPSRPALNQGSSAVPAVLAQPR